MTILQSYNSFCDLKMVSQDKGVRGSVRKCEAEAETVMVVVVCGCGWDVEMVKGCVVVG